MGKATREAYGNALAAVGAKNKNIVVLDADLSKSTKTNVFKEQFPDRFFNVGIAEQNLISVGAGLAAAGKIPFVSSFAMFATGRAFEQMLFAIQNLMLRYVLLMQALPLAKMGLPTNPLKISLACGSFQI